MELSFTAGEEAFRDEVRSFLRGSLPIDLSNKVLERRDLEREDYVRWQQILHERGWGAPSWPLEFGGRGWNAVEQFIFDEAAAVAGAPRIIPFGPKMVGPVLIRFGTRAQQQRFLPRILSMADWWCQGYSEPSSGSDLASLKTRAARDGDHYVVTGQKTWTTLAQYANWIFCLVRTSQSARPREGISFLLIDMASPGVSVRPIPTLDGTQEVNEVWFDDVRVPVENLVGAENEGWTYARFLLSHERTNLASVGTSKRDLRLVKRAAAAKRVGGGSLERDPHFAARIAQVEMDLMAFEITCLRALSADHARGDPGPQSSILKIKGCEIQQTLAELGMLAAGPASLVDLRSLPERSSCKLAGAEASFYLNQRKASIYGGTNEIQRNIVAQTILGR